MSEEQVGIKETLEVIEAVRSLAVGVARAVRDGDVNAVEVLSVFAGSVGEMITALRGVGEIPHEFGDLSQEEVSQLAAAGASIPFAVMDALRGNEQE